MDRGEVSEFSPYLGMTPSTILEPAMIAAIDLDQFAATGGRLRG